MDLFRKILNWIFALTFIVMLITAIFIQENSTYAKQDYLVEFSDGWMLAEPDGTRSEIAFPYHFQNGVSDIRLVRTLPQVPDHAVLLVMCNYNTMTAYVDGQEIYHSLPSTFGAVNTDMGHYVALIPLSASCSGKELTVHITERESGYRSEIRYIRLTSAAQYGFQIVEENTLHLVISVIMLICAAASFVVWFVLWRKNGIIPEENYHPLLWIGLFSLSMGVWFLTEAYIWAIATGSFAASGILNYLAISLMPVSLLGVLKSICAKKLPVLRWIVIAAKALLVGEWLLFLTGAADFSEMLLWIQAECILAATIFAVFLVWKRDLFLVDNTIHYGTWAMLGMLTITVITYFIGGDWLSCALCAALIILITVIVTVFLKVNRAIKDISQAAQYKEYALTDIMTGLKSRYAYTIFEANQNTALPSQALCLIFLDINLLKKANDTLGHVAGDEMIIAASRCIRDSFGDIAECFRMGGDEFLVATTADPELIRERLALFRHLTDHWAGEYVEHLTVSYGIAAAREHPDLNYEELLRLADHRMYQHKKQQAAGV